MSLGNTPVNKAIAGSVANRELHNKFPLFHNGVTLLAEKAEIIDDEKVRVTNYVVVNGAQTVSTFYKNRSSLSADLRVPVRVVELEGRDELGKLITQFSNNQNAIKPQDMRANHAIQLRLQSEMRKEWSGRFDLLIKRGEDSSADTKISNETAGLLLLAFDLELPWNCHQAYKVFDENYSDVFGRREVNADRIVFVHIIMSVIQEHLNAIDDKPFASYKLTRYFLLYIVGRIIKGDTRGKIVFGNPMALGDRDRWGRRLHYCLDPVVSGLVIDLNYELAESSGTFDYKLELKANQRARTRADTIIKSYEKDVSRGKAKSFGDLWDESAVI